MIRINQQRCCLIGVLVMVLVGSAAPTIPMRDYLGEWLSPTPDGVFLNPADLAGRGEIAGSRRVSVNWGLRYVSEQRVRYVYDQFENTIGEAVFADNIGFNWVLGPVSIVYPFRRFALGAGLAPVRDFHYRYLKEYRDEFYVKIGEDRLEQRGFLYSGNIGAAFKPIKFIALGAGFCYAWGERELKSTMVRGLDTVDFSVKSGPKGLGWNAGLTVAPLLRFSAGLSYQSRLRFNGLDSFDLKGYPERGQIELNYQAPGQLPSQVKLVVGAETWSEIYPGLHNVIYVQTTVEHIMLNSVRLRYGFGLRPLCTDPTVHRVEALFGLGFNAGRYRINLDGNLNREALNASDFALMPEDADFRAYETKFNLRTGVEYEF
ncbi:MAG: hypothetical protein WHU95_05370 [candidate division WOR-3 bacterium]|nr:outer membrane protein transport protein [candidate division WOR-3 bacterium]MDH7519110.1 hypothetical protein [bacterium]